MLVDALNSDQNRPLKAIQHGLDVIDTKTLEQLSEEALQAWKTQVFTPSELQDDNRRTREASIRKLAGKFAVKEALYKAVGGSLSGEIDWREIEVLNDRSGRPLVKLSGLWREWCTQLGLAHLDVSISHAGTLTFGSAIVVLESLLDQVD